MSSERGRNQWITPFRLNQELKERILKFVRQNPVRGIGLGCCAVGVLMIFGAVVSEAALAMTIAMGGSIELPEGSSWLARLQLRHHTAFASGQALLGVVTVFIGRAFLRRLPWAYSAVVGLVWFELALIVIGGVLSILGASGQMFWFFLVGGTLVMAWLSFLLLKVNRFLLSPLVRQAYSMRDSQ